METLRNLVLTKKKEWYGMRRFLRVRFCYGTADSGDRDKQGPSQSSGMGKASVLCVPSSFRQITCAAEMPATIKLAVLAIPSCRSMMSLAVI